MNITDILLIRYSAVSSTASSFTKPVSSRKKSISIPMMLPGMGRPVASLTRSPHRAMAQMSPNCFRYFNFKSLQIAGKILSPN